MNNEIEKSSIGDTQLEILQELKELGYVHNFTYSNGSMVCSETRKAYSAADLKLEALYRFEGISDPEYEMMICVFKAGDGTGGVFIDAFGAQANAEAAEFCRAIPDVRDESDLMKLLPTSKAIVIKSNIATTPKPGS